jgi:hypothetical protein
MYQGFSLPLLPKRVTPFIGATLRNTLSPFANSKSLRLYPRNSFASSKPRSVSAGLV